MGESISLSVKNEPIEQVFKQVEQQSGYYFTYTKEQIARVPAITLTVNNRPLVEVIDLLLKDLPLTYEITGGEIILRDKVVPRAEHPAPEQDAVLRGRIVDDSDGTPLAGVIISIKGSRLGILSDKNGFFTLSGVNDQTVLVFSFVSYLPLEKKIGPEWKKQAGSATDTLLIPMQRALRNLDSVVVNTGLYHRPVGNFTGAATSLSGDELKAVNPVRNAVKALAVLDPQLSYYRK